eukprot:891007-Pelagomonas_calceolata.AAC.6
MQKPSCKQWTVDRKVSKQTRRCCCQKCESLETEHGSMHGCRGCTSSLLQGWTQYVSSHTEYFDAAHMKGAALYIGTLDAARMMEAGHMTCAALDLTPKAGAAHDLIATHNRCSVKYAAHTTKACLPHRGGSPRKTCHMSRCRVCTEHKVKKSSLQH